MDNRVLFRQAMGKGIQMCRNLSAFLAGLLLCLLVAGVAGESNDGTEAPAACVCAMLNFWDTVPREEATQCCEHLDKFCQEGDTLRCGHVYRFCLKHRAGYSAWVLDHFVRDKLRPLNCPQFNPDATHDEACGEGWCRTGYGCTTVRAEICKKNAGTECGKGYCRNGATCGELSSQVCKKMSEAKLKKKQKNGEVFEDVKCTDGKCSVCQMQTEYECVHGNDVSTPCEKEGCADGLLCGPEEEEVCTIRPEALLFIGDKEPEEHKPEKVDESLVRFTAFILPTVGGVIGVLVVIALISYGTIRIRRARKETAARKHEDAYDEEEKPEGGHGGDLTARSALPEQDLPLPLSPCASPSQPSHHKPGFHLPLGSAKVEPDVTAPYSGRKSARRHSRGGSGCFRLFTPRSGYQSMTDVDLDAQALRGHPDGAPVDYDGDHEGALSARRSRNNPV